MEIKIHKLDDITVMDLIGNLDTSTSPDAESSISTLLDAGIKKLVINLEKTDYMSSSGLRVFLGTAKRMMASGGKVTLSNPNELVTEILQHSGFDTIINISPTQEEAVKYMQ